MSDVRRVSPRIPPDERYARRRRRVRIGAAATAVTLLAATAVYFALWKPAKLTDSPDAFGAEMREVMGRIHDQNAEVRKKNPHDYVTIVVLLPLSAEWQAAGMSKVAMEHALQGSYLAQLWHNTTQPKASRVRLLVGASGPDDWEDTVEDLRSRLIGDRIAAVVGLGASTAATKHVITELGRDNVAMVAAVLTSDDVNARHGFVRLAPRNSDQAVAGARFVVDQSDKAIKAVIVEDTNPSQHYSRTLHDNYKRVLERDKDVVLMPGLTFDSSNGTSGAVLSGNAQAICNSEADYVFYAGRAEQLPTFLRGLNQWQGCVERGIRVIAPDDTSELGKDESSTWQDSGEKIKLYYTALAHSANVTDPQSKILKSVRDRFGTAKDGYQNLFPNGSLDDGDAIMHYDAVCVAMKAIDDLLPEKANEGKQLEPKHVSERLRSGSFILDGASGHIEIDKYGNASRPELPVVRLMPNGDVRLEKLVSLAAR
ncbi:hypothetical protein [Nonomuraea sp. NPDC050643]|uniref:hypothetical protein n=1 Tax=Nonomuraea sp. NPDC050643 TaxID=3155660 RepID=UPI0033FA216C